MLGLAQFKETDDIKYNYLIAFKILKYIYFQETSNKAIHKIASLTQAKAHALGKKLKTIPTFDCEARTSLIYIVASLSTRHWH